MKLQAEKQQDRTFQGARPQQCAATLPLLTNLQLGILKRLCAAASLATYSTSVQPSSLNWP